MLFAKLPKIEKNFQYLQAYARNREVFLKLEPIASAYLTLPVLLKLLTLCIAWKLSAGLHTSTRLADFVAG